MTFLSKTTLRPVLRAVLVFAVFATLVGSVFAGCDTERVAQTMSKEGMTDVNSASMPYQIMGHGDTLALVRS